MAGAGSVNFHVNAEGILGKLEAVEESIAETGSDKLRDFDLAG